MTDRKKGRDRGGGVTVLELTGGVAWCDHCQQVVAAAIKDRRRVCAVCLREVSRD